MKNAWAAVWIRPRSVVRGYLDSPNPDRGALPIAMLAGIARALDMAAGQSLGNRYSWTVLTVLIVLAGSLGGIVWLYLASAVLKVTGKWLGGRGTWRELKAALTRGSNAPVILLGLLWIPELLIFRGQLFSSYDLEANGIGHHLLLLFIYILKFTGSVWIFILTMKSIGEAHRFTASKAFWSAMLPGLIITGFITLAVVVTGFFL